MMKATQDDTKDNQKTMTIVAAVEWVKSTLFVGLGNDDCN